MPKPGQLGDHYWSMIEPFWLKLNSTWERGPRAFVRCFRSIRPEVGHIYAGHWCHSEVCNGGFHQFFSNTTGLLAPEALAGFRAIGVTELANMLAEAMLFFGTPYPRERDDRQYLLPPRQGPPRERWDPFSRLDELFYEWAPGWEDAAIAHADRVRGQPSPDSQSP
jgi:hypothetical protein